MLICTPQSSRCLEARRGVRCSMAISLSTRHVPPPCTLLPLQAPQPSSLSPPQTASCFPWGRRPRSVAVASARARERDPRSHATRISRTVALYSHSVRRAVRRQRMRRSAALAEAAKILGWASEGRGARHVRLGDLAGRQRVLRRCPVVLRDPEHTDDGTAKEPLLMS